MQALGCVVATCDSHLLSLATGIIQDLGVLGTEKIPNKRAAIAIKVLQSAHEVWHNR